MFRKEWDYVLIPDTRFPNEIEYVKSSWVGESDIYTIRVDRPNFDSGATEEQLKHESECALDDYEFDSLVTNSGTLDDLRLKAKHYVEYVLKVEE